jgi:hypothetical protein
VRQRQGTRLFRLKAELLAQWRRHVIGGKEERRRIEERRLDESGVEGREGCGGEET